MSDTHRADAEAWIRQADVRWSSENSAAADLSAIAAALIGIGHALLAQPADAADNVRRPFRESAAEERSE